MEDADGGESSTARYLGGAAAGARSHARAGEHRDGAALRADEGGAERVDPVELRLSLVSTDAAELYHFHVPAWRMDAPDLQHVVPVAGRDDPGRSLGTRGVSAVLCGGRTGGDLRACARQP